ncbi:MAG: sugar phosphate isomerase/epimerase [Hespellia sp.]|nr:sugar phosphate isomerase/epimerase [Hespellia sp.]
MKLGCFGSCNQLDLIEEAGYDCAELDFCELADMDLDTYENFKKKALDSKLGFEVFSGLLPLSERFHTPDFDLEYWLEHTRKGAVRAAELGCRMIPFGAGKCRSIPEGYDKEVAAQTVANIVRSFGALFEEYNIRFVIEPLGPPNSNFLNTLPEVEEFLKIVNHPNCSSMCDLRHMVKSEESFDDIFSQHSIIKHAHIDYPEGLDRFFPLPDDWYDYKPYLKALKESNYTEILTVEATAVKEDFSKEATTCCKYLRELLKEA